jgi:hypothetical protein
MDKKIISFPPERITRSQDPTIDEIDVRVKLMRTYHVQEVVEALMPVIFAQLSIGGFDLSDETDLKDAAFITEAIRSVLLKQKDIDHPFQQLADNIFIDQESGQLSIVDKINIDFNSEPEEAQEVVPS